MKTITKQMTIIAVFLFGGLNIQALANNIHTYYFNGMNTTKRGAEKELEAIKMAIDKSEYGNYARDFDPKLIYTTTYGKIPDAIRIATLETGLRMFIEDPAKYPEEVGPGSFACRDFIVCNRINTSMLEYRAIREQMVKDGVLLNNGIGSSIYRTYYVFPANAKVQFISYSRGNVFANLLQEEGYDGERVKRTNIASPANHVYGDLFTLVSDNVIYAYTSAKRNKNPQYYKYLSQYYKKLFDTNNFNYREHGPVPIEYENSDHEIEQTLVRVATNDYFFFRLSKTNILGEPVSQSSARGGHSLINCYLNKRFGLYDDIVLDIVYKYYLLGGR